MLICICTVFDVRVCVCSFARIILLLYVLPIVAWFLRAWLVAQSFPLVFNPFVCCNLDYSYLHGFYQPLFSIFSYFLQIDSSFNVIKCFLTHTHTHAVKCMLVTIIIDHHNKVVCSDHFHIIQSYSFYEILNESKFLSSRKWCSLFLNCLSIDCFCFTCYYYVYTCGIFKNYYDDH